MKMKKKKIIFPSPPLPRGTHTQAIVENFLAFLTRDVMMKMMMKKIILISHRDQRPIKHHANLFSAPNPLSFHPNTKLFQPDTSGDWKPQAKHLDRSLSAHTPAPSTPSSMGALVHDKGFVTKVSRHGMAASYREWLRT